MSEWKKVKLGECITTKKGFAFKSVHYTSEGVPIVRVSDFTLNSITDKDLVYYPVSEYNNYKDYVLTEKDILIQTVGSWQYNPNSVVGKVVRVPYYHQGSLLNQNIVKIIPIERIDKDYLYYRIKCVDFSGYVIGEARGAANQASITLDTIKRFSFLLPPKDVQIRIATILSRYDSLIENYQKQIKLLEEAAQRLYKEWFVDLRFPGYENTKVVDGVPEGWEKKKLGEIILKSIGGGWGKDYPQEKFDKEGFVIRGTDISKLKYGNLDEIPFRFHTESNLKERTLCDGDIIFEVSGGSDKDPVGRMYFMTKPILDYYKKDVICASFCKKISFPNKLVSLLCFYAMQYCRNSGDMKKYEKDSAGNIINFAWTTFLENFHMLVPNENFLKNFYKIANANINQQVNISLQIRLLTEARDRLLPRLMGGEMEI